MSMNEPQIITFLSVTLLLTITPGVDTFLVIRNILRGGKNDGIYTGIGICSGLFVHASISAVGVSFILLYSGILFNGIKLLGGAYLFWLGLTSLWSAWKIEPDADSYKNFDEYKAVSCMQSFREGLFSNILNPKPALFYFAFSRRFLSPGENVFIKTILLAGIQFLIGVSWLIFLSFTLSALQGFIRRPLWIRTFKGLAGGVLIYLGLKLAVGRE